MRANSQTTIQGLEAARASAVTGESGKMDPRTSSWEMIKNEDSGGVLIKIQSSRNLFLE